MNSASSDVKLHVFICTNQKGEGKPCCASLGGKEIREQLKNRIGAHRELKGKVRINASGCLDKCTEGVACVIYPQGEWLSHVSVNDLDALEQKILLLSKD